jgi:Na+/proline symporter
VVAGILAAAMSTISSSISALASSMTNDLYASFTGRSEPAHLLKVGRAFSLLWGLLLMGGALAMHVLGSGRDTPVVVLALSVASVTYGALLGALLLATWGRRLVGADVVWGAGLAIALMLVLVFAGRFSGWWPPLQSLGQVAFVWYVQLGTAATLVLAWAAARWRRPFLP